MSEFTSTELASGTLVGMVADLGRPWWGAGHFAGGVPLDEARKLLTVNVAVGRVVVELEDPTPIFDMIATATTLEDAQRYTAVLAGMRDDAPNAEAFQAVCDADTGHVFQVAGRTWSNESHQYEAMLDHASALLDASAGELMIGSVIALDHKQKAMVQVRPPQGVTIGGDLMLPWLAMYSSLDSSWASGIKGATTRAVCDNTAAMVLGERTNTCKRKHTKNSRLDVAECRRTIDLFFNSLDGMAEEVERLQNAVVTEDVFASIVARLLPVAPNATSNAATRRVSAVGAIEALYTGDPRVAPHNGTAWGVVQAFSTYAIHGSKPRGGRTVADRQAWYLISGQREAADERVRTAVKEFCGV